MILELDEWSSVSDIELSDGQVRALARHDAFDVRPDPDSSGRWRVGSRHKVGAVTVEGLELRVRPKVPVAAVLSLLSEAIGRVQFDDDLVEFAASPDLLPVVAGAFCRHAESAIRLGPIQGYRTVEDSILGVRGRLNLGAQVRRRTGLPLPVEVTYDEYSPDIIENQLLAGATRLLMALPSVVAHHHLRLVRLRRRLENVTPHPPSHHPPTVALTRLNARYADALTLARLILSSAALEEGDDRQLPGTGLLVDMNKLFEDLVGEGLRRALEPVGGHVKVQEVLALDVAGHTTIRPDVVWRVGGDPVAVVDAKYKVEKPAGFPNADLYQMLAYCTTLELPEGHLVYAKGNAESATHEVRHAGVTIHTHTLDLAEAPPALLGQVDRLAQRVAGTAPVALRAGALT